MKQLLTVAIIFFSISGYSQLKDTTEVHSPRKATLKSAIIPGWGQAYNKKYWKIPVIYGAGFACIYFVKFGNENFQDAKSAFIIKSDANNTTVITNKYANPAYTTTILEEEMAFYRRNRDFSYILLGLIYILNVLDATVDAHLINYNVSDDLSIKIEPSIEQNAYIGLNNGLKLSIRF